MAPQFVFHSVSIVTYMHICFMLQYVSASKTRTLHEDINFETGVCLEYLGISKEDNSVLAGGKKGENSGQ